MSEQPDSDQLEWKQRDDGNGEHHQRRRRRQRIDAIGKPLLELGERNYRDNPRHDRLEMVP